MVSLLKLDFHHLRQKLVKKEISTSEVINTYIQRAEETFHLNAYVLDTFEQAREQAKESDKRYAKGEARPLEGLPLATKDIFCTKDIRTTICSKILENFIPTYESTVTHKLNQAGAISLGKTNLDEFAMGSSTLTSCFGPSINPLKRKNDDTDLTPGGSSGGSSASVAAGSSLVALGTDTGGSIRQPASHCGIVGIKPTYGRCSRYGIIAFASSLDHAGPMARTVRDAALVLEHMAGHDPKDSTCLPHAVPQYTQSLTGNVKGLKIGIPKEYNLDGLHPDIARLWQQSATWFKEMGAEIVDISLPHTEYGLAVYYIVNPAEASSNLARYDGVRYGLRVEGQTLDEMYERSRTAGFGDEVKRRIMIGTHALSAGCYEDYYLRAQKVRRKILNDFQSAFQKVDFILTPTTASDAFALNDPSMDPLAMYLEDVFTVAANLAGIPAISVPVGFSEKGLPLGMQLLGPMLSEDRLFNAAFALETAAQFKHPIIEAL
ncbi:MAG: Asp-tRNA(Asn)/Glu-tRNA(Gln) amidotransferase subunit GatA [Alphaproteobacteria bacterium]